jgi:aspartate carbamoyltransferase catalytic subunit
MSSTRPRHIISIDDLSNDEIAALMGRARTFETRGKAKSQGRSFSVALVFLQPSTRTRAGLAEAAIRLGGIPIDLTSLRYEAGMSAPETFADTIRTISGMVDLVITRTAFALNRSELAGTCHAPLLNGGDDGGHHPSQALVDLYAIERMLGPVSALRLTMCGDLTMRAARSLIRLLCRAPPKSLQLVAPPSRADHGVKLPPELAGVTSLRTTLDVSSSDVVYMVGLPEGEGQGHLDAKARSAYILDGRQMRQLPTRSVVLCPLPVIDEINDAARHDPRVRMFEQSDFGVYVRMAVIESLVGGVRSEALSHAEAERK